MAEQEKTKNHPGGLSDKADEADPKMKGQKENFPLATKSGLIELRLVSTPWEI
ncbi:Hypothetical predicted protein [Paramuricea clavata]|uniref:Uncharacterized protein n=1 Tax=Paramuricea clavata TaxID=317549 RepID=A0A6S7IDR8_PARCT|nr:Hypothetical predicted protein [Paramuricea clavata]